MIQLFTLFFPSHLKCRSDLGFQTGAFLFKFLDSIFEHLILLSPINYMLLLCFLIILLSISIIRILLHWYDHLFATLRCCILLVVVNLLLLLL